MSIPTEKKLLVLASGLLLLLASCQDSASPAQPQVKSASTTAAVKDSGSATVPPVPVAEAALATLRTPHYELKIFEAISFVPNKAGTEEIRLKPGFRYLVLEVAVQNRAKDKALDMGQVLLSAKLQDKKGKVYPLNAMAMAAFTLDNPDPQHQAQYNAIWGKLQPGEIHRTKAIGFEVPDDQRSFTLSLNADDNSSPQTKRQEVKFVVE